MSTNTTLRGVSVIHEPTLSDQLESNLIEFFNYGFLNIGGFVNVTINTSGAYGGQPYKLRLSEDHRYTSGQVWEGFRKDWVWESGVECAVQPISISGIFVNSTFYPLSTSGAFSYKIDYPNGKVVFNTAISTTSTVTCEYSYRYFQIDSPDAPWYKKLQDNSFRVDNNQFHMKGSGQWNTPPEQRVQLPAIVIEAYPNVHREPVGLGMLAQRVKQEIRYHIMTETRQDFKFLHDVITDQNEKSIIFFDKKAVIRATGMPLNYDGSLAGGAKTYPDLIKPVAQGGYEWRTMKFRGFRSWLDNTGGTDYEVKPPFYSGTISGIVEIDVP